MKKKALLIASQTFGLEGCHQDLALMEECLGERGFGLETCKEKNATRAGILDRYRSLIQDARPDDSLVIYYSGHGGLAPNPAWRPDRPFDTANPRFFQFIVPTDLDECTEDDFRGILNLELSLLLAELTRKTVNVTVILDCCHSASMFRDMRPRALSKSWNTGVAEHLARLRADMTRDWRSVSGNPHAVRLAAAGFRQSAYEYPGGAQGPVGLFTESLTALLSETKDSSVSWSSVLKCVRERVLVKQPWQRPEAEGPGHRLLFDTRETRDTGVLTFFNGGSPFYPRPSLRGGRILGVEVGNVYALMPPGSEVWNPEKQLGTARVTEVLGGISRVEIDPPYSPPGLSAFPVEESPKTYPVLLSGQAPAGLWRSIEKSKFLRIATGSENPIAVIEMTQGLLDVHDSLGFPIAEPAEDVSAVIHNLERLARAETLRALECESGRYALTASFDIAWGRVFQGRANPLTSNETELYRGDRIYARIVNRDKKSIFVNIIDIGISRRIFLLNRAQPSGVEVMPDSEECLGHRPFDGLVGLKLSWPGVVPPKGPQLGTWLTIVSDRPQDLTVLESDGVTGANRGDSVLQRLLTRLSTGGKRKRASTDDQTADVRYAVCRTDFLLHPNKRPANRTFACQ